MAKVVDVSAWAGKWGPIFEFDEGRSMMGEAEWAAVLRRLASRAVHECGAAADAAAGNVGLPVREPLVRVPPPISALTYRNILRASL